MSLPPVPPRPPTVVAPTNNNNNYESPPHFDNPLVAPRPHRVDPQIGANVSSVYYECGMDGAFTYGDVVRLPAAAVGLVLG
jgi:hypothetical protein